MADNKQQFEDALNGIQNKEPVLLGTAVVQLIVALIALLASWGIDMSDAQQDALWQSLAAFSVVLWMVAPVIRQHVWSPASVEKLQAEKE